MPARILVVEDSATQALVLCEVLEAQNFRVDRVASGEQATEFLEREKVDLVLSDIVMTGMTGYELCHWIKGREELATIPVVLLTSLTDPVDIVRGLECGADNYVTKPYDADYLCARIRHVLDRQRLRRVPRASLGVAVTFLGTTFSITSDREQILDLFISSVEDIVRTNAALQQSQRELADAQARLEERARGLADEAQRSAEKYALLMHEANDVIAVLDVEGRILEANVRAAELFARDASELRGQPLTAFATSGGRKSLDARIAQLRSASRVEAHEVEFVDGSGKRFCCDFSASRTHSGSDDLVLAILHDITQVKETSERLRRSEALLSKSQRIAKLGSWERDLITGEAQWSEVLYELLDLDPATTPRTLDSVLSAVHPEDRAVLKAEHDRVTTQLVPMNLEFRVGHSRGSTRVIQARAEVVAGEPGIPERLTGTLQDITERKHLEEQLMQAQKMEAIGQLAGGVAHDFNNLLTVITNYSEMLIDDGATDPAVRADIEQIKGAADRAAALTRQLLAFSRRQMLQPQVVDVNALTHQLEKLLRRLVREDIEIVTELFDEHNTVWADPGQLEQVVVNLVVNARDAMPDGGTLRIRTSRSSRTAEMAAQHIESALDEWVVLEVSDTGTGMSPEIQARIFEPFFTTKEPGKGTGLGLATVYGIVRQSGGDVAVETAPDMGTTFRVYLPFHDGTASGASTTVAAAPSAPDGGETVLIVEDDEALRAVACRVLRQRGYNVIEAESGRAALEQTTAGGPVVDLVITDMVMPEMSGYELAQRIRAQRPDARVLFMSGYTRDTTIRDGIAQGGDHFLEKPFSPSALAAKVRSVLTDEVRPRGK